jgi:gliding motility-associated-like protein
MPSRFTLCFIGLLASTGLAAQGGGAFVENRGQWPEHVRFKADMPGAAVWCARDGVILDRYAHRYGPPDGSPHPRPIVTDHHVVRLTFLNTNKETQSEGVGVQRGAYNYFLGTDPAYWASGAHAFRAVLQREVYPGIDLRWRTSGGLLKYDLLIAPGSDPDVVRFTYEGSDGQVLTDDHLVIRTSLGDVVERIPIAYQERNGAREVIPCHYRLKGDQVSFALGTYDPSLPLIIDPTLEFSTYSGSTTDNFGYSASYDADGFLYAGSSSFGNGYPTSIGAYQTFWAGGDGQGSIPGTDMALTKFDTTGSFLIWSTMYGGSGDDLPHSLVVNSANELYVLGTTGSPNLPTTVGAHDNSFGGGTAYTPEGIGVSYPLGADMVVAKFSADGTQLLGGTFLGGSLNDGHNSSTNLKVNYADEMRGEILLDADENVVIVSCTTSPDFPTTAGAPQTSFGGGTHDGVVSRLNSTLTTLTWSTFFGGNDADAAFSGELDPNGDLYICGGTTSTNLPTTTGAYQTAFQGGQADAFVARYAPDGSSILNCTYYGSSAYDQAYLMDLDQASNPFLFGQTLAANGELVENAAYTDPTGGQFICKLDPLLGTRYMGARFGDLNNVVDLDISPTAFLVDYCNKLYVSGWGSSIFVQLSTTGMPVTGDAFQATTDGQDFYLAVFEVDMSALSYGTYFGGGTSTEHVDGGTSQFDRRGRVYEAVCAGCGSNDDFPHTPDAWSATNNSPNCNLGVFKFDFNAPLVIADPAAPSTLCAGSTVQFQNQSILGATYFWDFGDTGTSTAVAPSHTYTSAGTYTVTLTASNPNACNLQDMDSIQVIVLPAAPLLQADPDIALCGPTPSSLLSCTSFGTATQFIWSTSPTFSDTLNSNLSDSTALLIPPIPGTYYVQASTPGSCTAVDQLMIGVSLVNAAISPGVSICADDTATLTLTGIDPGSTIAWSPADQVDGGQGTTSIQVSPAEAQQFTAQVTSPTGCTWSGSADVLVSPLYGSSVGASVDQPIVTSGTTVQLSATPTTGVSYSWQPAAAVSNPTIANPTAFITQTTAFILTITDGICTRNDTVLVSVYELNCAEPDVFLPDAFTPNADGNNDVLYVRGRNITALDLKVFDRWGELVFETQDLSKGWDGTFKGKPVDPAVYVYWLDVLCVEGQSFFKKGNVTVIR